MRLDLIPLRRLQLTAKERAWSHALLIRRSTEDPEVKAHYVVFAPQGRPRWKQSFQSRACAGELRKASSRPKDVCGLDEYRVRRCGAWHRHMTLSLLAHAFLAALAVREKKKGIRKMTQFLKSRSRR